MEYWDIYILKNERHAEKLCEYAIKKIPSFDLNNEVGEYSLNIGAKKLSITNAREFIYSGCFYKKSYGGIRLVGEEQKNPNGGWVYFNSDGTVVFGLTVKESTSEKMLSKLKEATDSTYGYIAGDGPPANGGKEFVELCAK